MNIINRLKAFFTHNNEAVELDLIAAEIKNGKAFLHPKDQENITYLVRSNDIEICLSKGRTLTEKDILKFEPKPKWSLKKPSAEETMPAKNKKTSKKQRGADAAPQELSPTSKREFDRYKKRKLVVSLYPEEYDMVVSVAKEYGYKRADFLLACVTTASKTTMTKAHKKILKSHVEIKKAQQAWEAQKSIPQ